MAGEIVNLRRARKAKARQEREATAAERRVKFGRSKHDLERDAAEARIEGRRLDGHRLDPEPDA